MEAKTRLVLANNLKALMAARPDLNTFAKIVAAGGPSNGTLDRIRRHDAGCSVDQVDLLAKVFELDPWQLVVPGLQPNNPPILLGAGGEVEQQLWGRIARLMVEIKDLREASPVGEPAEAAEATASAEGYKRRRRQAPPAPSPEAVDYDRQGRGLPAGKNAGNVKSGGRGKQGSKR